MASAGLRGASTIHTESLAFSMVFGKEKKNTNGPTQKDAEFGFQIGKLLTHCVAVHRAKEEEEKAMTKEQNFVVMEGHGKAYELTKEGAAAGVEQLAAAIAFAIKHLSNDTQAPTQYAAYFHVQVEEWKDRDEMVPTGTESWRFVRREIQVCAELEAQQTCTNSFKNWMGTLSLFFWEEEAPDTHTGSHDLQRMVDVNGKMLFRCCTYRCFTAIML